MNGSRIVGEVRVVGSGLLGASVGLGLRAAGVDVILADASPANLRLAIDYGAGRPAKDTDNPTLIVVAVPPDVTASVIAAAEPAITTVSFGDGTDVGGGTLLGPVSTISGWSVRPRLTLATLESV